MNLQALCWQLEDLPAAIAAITGLREPLSAPSSVENLTEWMQWAALRCHAEAHAADVPLRDLERLIASASPAIYELEASYLVVAQAGKTVKVLAPDLSWHKVAVQVVAEAIRKPFTVPHLDSYRELVSTLQMPRSKQEKVLETLLTEQTGARRFRRCWCFRVTKGAGIGRAVPKLIACHTAQYLLWLASWGVLGSLSFSGHLDRGWMLAWALLLLTLLPFRLLTSWTQGTFAVSLGAMLKRRLLQGALKLQPEEVRAGGVGSFLGQALECESIETLAITGGVTGLLAIVELIPSMFVLGHVAIALALWCGVASFAAWRFLNSYKRWTAERLELTHHLVESMSGHRTRLAQSARSAWHAGEDVSLARYLNSSAGIDSTGSWLMAAVPRGWLLVGLGCVAPSLVSGHALSSATAVLLGGVLLAFSAFQRLAASCADIAGAITSWQRLRPLLEASQRNKPAGEVPPDRHCVKLGSRLLEAERLTFRYPSQFAPALQSCSLTVHQGEKILLEGASGGGKTTLASLLSGLRTPDSGLLLLNGLDRHSLGEYGWRKQVAAAPQFHENHILSETLAFNLLMGRHWPPSDSDLADAEELCHELGLGELITRMPGGLMQMVGEGGWQLSHGERSRIFLARALLQQAPLVILDESFAALDSENLQLALETSLRRAETLLVIAHP